MYQYKRDLVNMHEVVDCVLKKVKFFTLCPFCILVSHLLASVICLFTLLCPLHTPPTPLSPPLAALSHLPVACDADRECCPQSRAQWQPTRCGSAVQYHVSCGTVHHLVFYMPLSARYTSSRGFAFGESFGKGELVLLLLNISDDNGILQL